MMAKAVAIGLILLILVCAILLFSGGKGDPNSPVNLIVNQQVAIPTGYTFIGAAAWGGYSGYYMTFCQNDTSGRYYECTGGAVGREIVLPEGYILVDVASWGLYSETRTYYCQKPGEKTIFICNPG